MVFMPAFDTGQSTIKPTHKAIQGYYAARQSFDSLHVSHEIGVRTAFQNLLTETARSHHWILVTEQTLKVGGKHIRPDGVMRDEFNLPRGYWEAKDTDDDLDEEIRKKSAKGYPLTNIIFEDTREAALYQDGQERFRADLTTPQQVADLLNQFYDYAEPDIESFEQAVAEFQERVPELATGLADKIRAAHKDNKKFQTAYATFFELCKTALNPNISQSAVDEMLVQHLLTERLIRKIFDNPDFMDNNAIAVEIEKVIRALVSPSFSREEYLKSLDRFYRAIEDAAHGLEDFAEKQHFLNSIYERFFQGYSVKIADTHGIVYTPQPIVDFMCASVVEVLQTEFGKTLGDPDVVILDPATGTGNFIVNLLRRIPRRDLKHAYKERLFANEIMLLPYYIAALNIEHAYYELTGQYEPFEGVCFVDTLDIAEGAQLRMSFITEANSTRVERQKQAPITVIIGNPPYNVGQVNENDNNKNRTYDVIDERVAETYSHASKATSKSKLNDPYVKFFRWASDRLQGRDGIVCYVSNNSFVDQIAFDGMRQHLLQDFTRIYHIDLHGNVRKNPKLSGTTHNVFGIQVGVGITIAIRSNSHSERQLVYCRVPEDWRKEEKLHWLTERGKVSGIQWQTLTPDNRYTWLVPENADDFASFMPMGSKNAKEGQVKDAEAIFKTYSLGVTTARDELVYDFDRLTLTDRVHRLVEDYNAEVDRYKRANKPSDIDGFVRIDSIKWSETLKLNLKRGRYAQYDGSRIRQSVWRPYCKKYLYYDTVLNERPREFSAILPTVAAEGENQLIWLKVGSEWPMFALLANHIVDLLPQGGSQCFPFYVYDQDGNNRRENITDWALRQFRDHYGDESIGKWDIFDYVYGVLHHPGYREKFADNLKRDLPRIPFAPDFRAFAEAGLRLADLHLNYEQVEPYPLQWIEAKDEPLSYRVEKMRLSKDKTQVVVNDSLTLAGIPPEVFEYRLGNRSALDWVIDQYQVTTDKRSGITSDPNREDEPRYIVDLVGRVITVSVETVKIVAGLPASYSKETTG
jgi:predicted helicase